MEQNAQTPMPTIRQNLEQALSLHRELNSPAPAADLDERYSILFENQAQQSRILADKLKSDQLQANLHDGWVRGFSERRCAGGWNTRFFVDACTYQNQGDDQPNEVGLMRVDIRIQTTEALRAISGKEIHSCLLSPDLKEIGFLFHRGGRMDILTAKINDIQFSLGPLRTYDDLRQSQLETINHLPATMTVHHAQGSTQYPARWYVNGALMLQDEGRWQNYGQWSGKIYDSNHPKVSHIDLDTGIPGVVSQVDANSDDWGWTDPRPLVRWFKQQNNTAARRKNP
jgi:hypothetical protein